MKNRLNDMGLDQKQKKFFIIKIVYFLAQK